MALWHCAACTAAYAVGLARCPQCGSTERSDVPKINSQGQVSYEPSRRPAPPAETFGTEPQEHPGTGVPMTGIEAPADGTFSPLVSNPPAPGEPAGEQVTQLPPGESAEPDAPSLADAEAKIEAAQAELDELVHPVPPAGPVAASAPLEPVTLPPRRVPPPGA